MRLLAPVLLLAPLLSYAQTASPSDPSRTDSDFGAAAVPVALPSGASSAYALLGAPELSVGYRSGFGPVEAEVRARGDFLRLSLALEALARVPLYSAPGLEVGPTLALGFVANTGATYFDGDNVGGTFLRLMPGVLAVSQLSETVALVGALEVPVDRPLRENGGARWAALAGGGAEVYAGEDLSFLALGQLGPEALTAAGLGGPTTVRLGWRVQLGLGLRIF
jgi:hypothetical protein